MEQLGTPKLFAISRRIVCPLNIQIISFRDMTCKQDPDSQNATRGCHGVVNSFRGDADSDMKH